MELVEVMCKAVVPTLLDDLGESDTLVTVNVTGAINTQMFGIKAPNNSWADFLAARDIARVDTKWFGAMASIPPMNFMKRDTRTLLTTSPDDTFLTNGRRYLKPMNLAAMRVRTATSEISSVREFIANYSTTEAYGPYKLARPLAGKSEDGVAILRGCVSTLGYEVAKNVPVLFMDPVVKLITSADDGNMREGADITEAAILSFIKTGRLREGDPWFTALGAFLRFGIENQPPGVKYVPIVGYGVRYRNRQNVWVELDEMDGVVNRSSYGEKIVVAYMVPVVDDGLSITQTYWKCEQPEFGLCSNFSEYIAPIADTRYGNSDDYVNIQIKYHKLAALMGSETITLADGSVVACSAVNASSYLKGRLKVDPKYLMFLQIPVDRQHLIGLDSVTTTKLALSNGVIVNHEVHNYTAQLFCCKLDKEWYENYYQSGFGLYAPRNSNIQKGILEKWRALEFNEMGVCIDPLNATVSPSIVDSTDLAKRYKKARADACKSNDWDSQVYSSSPTKITYGELRTRISQQPKLLGAYAIDAMAPEPTFTRPSSVDIRWSVTGGVLIKSVASSGTEVARYTSADAAALKDQVLEDVANGAEASVAALSMTGANADEISAAELARAESKSGYLDNDPRRKGYVMKEQYFVPEDCLANSGYPVARFMRSPYVENMWLRCYADLRKIGDPLVRILNSFTGDVVVAKIQEKMK